MSKLPRYMKLKFENDSLTLNYKLTVKKWGIPLLVFKVMRENFMLPWYMWFTYPYIVTKVILKWGDAVD